MKANKDKKGAALVEITIVLVLISVTSIMVISFITVSHTYVLLNQAKQECIDEVTNVRDSITAWFYEHAGANARLEVLPDGVLQATQGGETYQILIEEFERNENETGYRLMGTYPVTHPIPQPDPDPNADPEEIPAVDEGGKIAYPILKITEIYYDVISTEESGLDTEIYICTIVYKLPTVTEGVEKIDSLTFALPRKGGA